MSKIKDQIERDKRAKEEEDFAELDRSLEDESEAEIEEAWENGESAEEREEEIDDMAIGDVIREQEEADDHRSEQNYQGQLERDHYGR